MVWFNFFLKIFIYNYNCNLGLMFCMYVFYIYKCFLIKLKYFVFIDLFRSDEIMNLDKGVNKCLFLRFVLYCDVNEKYVFFVLESFCVLN